jgi:RNA polymerase-binding transcription factor DksA
MSYLTKQQLAHFKTLLDAEQAHTRSAIEAIFEASDHVSHRLAVKRLSDFSSDELIEFTQKIDDKDLKRKIDNLKKLDASLNNLEQGMYGLCSDCEMELSVDVLNKTPTTQRCPRCEARYQKQSYNNYRL